jgi:polyisoprenoid-binding protein YceI
MIRPRCREGGSQAQVAPCQEQEQMVSHRKFVAFLVGMMALGVAGAASADTYDIDGAHSSASFSIKHLGVSYTQGFFTRVSGSFEADKSIDIVIDAASVYTADKKRDEHIRGADFLNARQHPRLTFKSTKVEKVSEGRFKVTGDLTIKGKTKRVTIDVTKVGEGKDPWGGYRMGYWTEFTIHRADFGVDYLPEGLSDEVNLRISVEGIKK